MNAKTLILGMGNPLLGDDGIGIKLIRDLKYKSLSDPHICFEECYQSGLYLLEYLIGYQRVIILDAMSDHAQPVGQITILNDLTKFKVQQGSSPHYIGIGSVLTLGKSYQLPMPEDILFIGINIHDSGCITENLSSSMNQAYPGILRKIKSEIKNFIAPCVHSV